MSRDRARDSEDSARPEGIYLECGVQFAHGIGT